MNGQCQGQHCTFSVPERVTERPCFSVCVCVCVCVCIRKSVLGREECAKVNSSQASTWIMAEQDGTVYVPAVGEGASVPMTVHLCLYVHVRVFGRSIVGRRHCK